MEPRTPQSRDRARAVGAALCLAGLTAHCGTPAAPIDAVANDATLDATADSRSSDVAPVYDSVPAPDGGRCVPAPTPGPNDLHVTVDGTPGGDGSLARPLDLYTALLANTDPGNVFAPPGATIWVHGGTYRGAFRARLTGTSTARITLRNVPGERVIIDGAGVPQDTYTLGIEGAWADYVGIEVTNSSTDAVTPRPVGINLGGPNVRLVNMVVHDVFNNQFFDLGSDAEIYGCLFYNVGYWGMQSGTTGPNYGYPAYAHNQTGSKLFEANVVFNNFSFGFHVYSGGNALLHNLQFVGNVWFNAGLASPPLPTRDDTRVDNLLVGAENTPADGILLQENLGWTDPPTERSVRLGWNYDPNADVTLIDNYLVGETNFRAVWNSITLRGNTFYGPVVGNVDTTQFPDNQYLTARPSGAKVFVRPNRYAPGRAHIVVYNWDLADAIDVDISSAISPGTAYEIRNVQNFFAPPVAAGVYDGRPVRLPMNGLTPVPSIVQPDGLTPAEYTGPGFNVFELLPVECAWP